MNFGSNFLERHTHRLLCVAHIASDFTCVYCAVAGTIFGTTDIYQLSFSYLSINIFIVYTVTNHVDKLRGCPKYYNPKVICVMGGVSKLKIAPNYVHVLCIRPHLHFSYFVVAQWAGYVMDPLLN